MEDKRNIPTMTQEDLDKNILVFIHEQRKNMKLINHISKQFLELGLNQLIPKELFEDLIEPQDLSREMKIAFLLGVRTFFNGDKKNEYDYLKPTNYFYDNIISSVLMLKPEQKEVSDTIIIDNVQRINNEEYQTVMYASQLSELKDNGLIVYFKEIQRASRIETIGNITIKRENYSKSFLKELEESFRKKESLASQITLSIILFDNKIPDFQFVPEFRDNYGKIIFNPEFNSESENYAFCSINDGSHRLSSIIHVFKKYGIDNPLSVAIKVISLEKARDLSSKSFRQATTDKLYVQSLKLNDENKFINLLIENTNIFKDNIAKSKAENKLVNVIGTYTDLVNEIKLLKFDVTNELKSSIKAKNISKNINLLFNVIEDNYGNISDIREKSSLLNKKSALIYLYLGNELLGKDEEIILNTALDLIQNQDIFKVIEKTNSIKDVIEKLKKHFDKEGVING